MRAFEALRFFLPGKVSMRSKVILTISIILIAILLVCGLATYAVFTRISPTALFAQEHSVPQMQANNVLIAPTSAAIPTLQPIATPVSDQLITRADAEELLLVNLYQRVNPSVVNIDVTLGTFEHPTIASPDENGGDEESTPPEEFNPFFSPQGQGSGFVYSDEGYIITNNHVIDGATEIKVTFYDGSQLPAEIVGKDLDSDLAVIKVDAPKESLLPVAWGDSNKLLVGQRAVAIGNPFGLDGSLTSGIISALGRSLPSMNQSFRIPEIIQTDAAVNPGNSGGPLLNSRGEVVGIINAIVPRQVGVGERSFLGVGFAIPGNLAQRVIPALIEKGAYTHPWLGIVGDSLTPEIAQAMSIKETQGALVIQVLTGSPAAKAHLQGGTERFSTSDGLLTQIGGDIIVGVEDETISEFDDIISFLSRRGTVGDTITLHIIRGGAPKEVKLTLEPRPGSDDLLRQ